MKKILLPVFSLCLISGALCGCTSDDPEVVGEDTVITDGNDDATDDKEEDPVVPEDNTRIDIALSTNGREIVAAQNDFAFRFLSALIETEDADKNLFFSPLGAAMNLSLLANGETEEGKRRILDVLGKGAENIDEVNALNKTLLESLPSVDKKTTMVFANSLWLNNEEEASEDFLSAGRFHYDMYSRNTNLFDVSGMEEINSWCNDKTNGMIPNFFDTPPYSRFVLMTALYFNGEWSLKFDKEETETADFKNYDGTTSKVEMMAAEDCYRESTVDGVKSVELLFGNEAYKMICMMPYEETQSVEEMVAGMTPEKWNEFCNLRISNYVTIRLPKFNIEYSSELNDAYNVLGGADFMDLLGKNCTVVTPKDDQLLTVIQKSKISVNENGAEASSAKADVGYGAVGYGPLTFIANRPFIYLIMEKSTNSIVFMGVIRKM